MQIFLHLTARITYWRPDRRANIMSGENSFYNTRNI